MRKMLLIPVLFISACFVNNGLAEITASKSFAVPDLMMTSYLEPADGATYQKIVLTGCHNLADSAGYPELPYKIVRLLIPAGETVTSIKIESYQSQPISGDYNVYPIQPPQLTGETVDFGFVAPNPLIYDDSKAFPGRLYEIAGDGYMSGYHILTLRLYPVQYSPKLKKITLYTDIQLKINTAPGGQTAVPVYQRNEARQKEIEAVILSQVDNPEALSLSLPQIKLSSAGISKSGILVQPFKSTGLPSAESMPIDYIIITNENLKGTFEQLSAWKTQKGITSQVKTVEWIDQNYSGCDLQEKIRNFIKNAYSYWGTSYVLLAGDHSINPARLGLNSDGGSYTYLSPVIPTDLYYSSLEGSWNANNNAVFGEPGSGVYVPVEPDYKIVKYFDASSGIILSDTLLYTTDAGVSWVPMPPAQSGTIEAGDFININNGWVISRTVHYTTIWKINDFGVPWQAQYELTLNNHINNLQVINDTDIWAVGFEIGTVEPPPKADPGDEIISKIWNTTDGQNWSEVNGPDSIAYALYFIDSDTGYVAGVNGQIAKTIDGGAVWQTFQTTTTSTFRQITFIDSQHGWACGDHGVIYHTSDGGNSWNLQNSGTTMDLHDIKFADTDTGWAISDLSILHTTNGGASWVISNNPGAYVPLSISVIAPNNIWISGCNGLLLHSADGVNWDIKHAGSLRWVITGDCVDFLPEVALGRAPLVTVAEAQAFVNKIINYEKNPPPSDYVTKILFMGGSAVPGNDGMFAKLCERMQNPYYTSDYIGLPSYFSKYELYGPVVDPTLPIDWEGDAELTKANATIAMNQGYHLIFHLDHSSAYSIGTGATTGGGNFNRVDAQNLTNENKCSILFSLGCDPNAFIYDCFSRHFIINPSVSGVAFIGNSIYGLVAQGWQARNYFYYLFKGITNNGWAFNTVKLVDGHIVPYFCAYNVNLMGDPEMPIWTNDPESLIVEHPSNIAVGQNSFIVTVQNSDGLPVDSALVCLQKGFEAYATGCTDELGQVTFDYTPETVGDFNITITTQNYLPYVGTCIVTPATGAYVCYESNQLNDDEGDSIHGNGDGIANPGESAGMYVTLKNTGTVSTPVIDTIDVTTSDPYINPNTFAIGFLNSIPAGGNAGSINQGVFMVSSDCPNYHRIVFHINIPEISPACADSFVVTIMADSLTQTGHVVETVNAGNYKITNLQITNFGSGAADGVTATLTSDDPNVTINIGESIIGAIASDGIVAAADSFSFSTSDLANAKFTLALRDKFNRQWTQNNFELVLPAVPIGLTAASTVDGVALKWAAVAYAVGYNVYRSNFSGGPYTMINRHAVQQTSYYLDKDAIPQTQYYYTVTALDTSANESGYSNEAQLYNSLSYKPGWPVVAGIRGDLNWSSTITSDIDGDGCKEVVLGTNDGHLYIFRHDGTGAAGVWPKNYGTAYVSTAIGDIDKCGLPEIIAGVGNATDFKLYIYKSDGSVLAESLIYSGTNSYTESAVSLGDIDRNGWLDIVLVCKTPCMVFDFKYDGTNLTELWHKTTVGSPTAACLGDINNDDNMEVLVGTWSPTGRVYAWQCDGNSLAAWPNEYIELAPGDSSAGISCQPVVGDINNDEQMEIVIENKGKIFVIESSGSVITSWWAGGRVWGSLALANLDRDYDFEIIAGVHIYSVTGSLAAWHHNSIECFNLPMVAPIHSSPIVGDLNNDGFPEIFNGYDKSIVLGYKSNGQVFDGFPLPTSDGTYSSPFMADLDGNGAMELGIDMLDGKIHVWEIPGAADPTPDWPMFRHDAMNSGTYGWLNEFSGHITRDLILSGDNFFNGDVVIDAGVTVTLKPNTRMYFIPSSVKNLGADPRCELIVNGTLVAQGVAGDSVRFLSWAASPTPGNWYGIRIESGGSAQLDYCVIENAATGLWASGSSPQISHSRIQGCETGIYCYASSAQITNTLIADNKPVETLTLSATKAVSDSLYTKTVDSTAVIGTGIKAINSNLTLDNNVIRNNYTGYYGGGTIGGTITNNTFEDNEYQGMDLYGDCFNMTITGNNFYRNAIPLNGTNIWEWAGISIGYRTISAASNITIESNLFSNNHTGARCTRYGSITTVAAFNLNIRDNSFTSSNEVGLSIDTDVSPNLTAIATSNYFTGNTIYGIYVSGVNNCPLNLGDLGNASVEDNGSNRLYTNGSYDLYYSVPAPIIMKAEGNYWNKRLASQVDARIYDDNENSAYGAVDFQPFYTKSLPNTNTVWTGIVSVSGDVVVSQDATLTIEPGTIVRFINNFDEAAGGKDTTKAELIVYGQIEFKNKPGDPPVIFQSDAFKPQAGDWGGIVLLNSNAVGESAESKDITARIFKNCIVRHATCGISIDKNQTIEMTQCKFEHNNIGANIAGQFKLQLSDFSNNKINGLVLSENASGSLAACNFVDNETGLHLSGHSTAECNNDTITSNNAGIICREYSTPIFKNTIINQNRNNGIMITDNAAPVFGDGVEGNNIISNNLPYNLYNTTSNNIKAKNNYWGTGNTNTVAKYIFDGNDDKSILGVVSYLPLWAGPNNTQPSTKLDSAAIAMPTAFSLNQNAPNPMAGFTSINFAVAKQGYVSLKVYNIAGQLVKTLANENMQPGFYAINWNGQDESGQKAASGVYFYRIQAGDFTNTKKLVILK